MQTKICKNCGCSFSTDEFYGSKNICIYCYKRRIRRNNRIKDGRPIKTVGELIKELISLPEDTKVFLFDDISVYRPTSVEFIRTILNGTKYDTDEFNNSIIID